MRWLPIFLPKHIRIRYVQCFLSAHIIPICIDDYFILQILPNANFFVINQDILLIYIYCYNVQCWMKKIRTLISLLVVRWLYLWLCNTFSVHMCVLFSILFYVYCCLLFLVLIADDIEPLLPPWQHDFPWLSSLDDNKGIIENRWGFRSKITKDQIY